MSKDVLSAEEVSRIIETFGRGPTITQKVKSIAEMTQTSVVTLYGYKKHGAKRGPLNVLLTQMLTNTQKITSVNINTDI